MSMHQRTGFGENAWFQDNLLAFSFLWQPFNMIDPLIALSRDWLEAYSEMVTPLSLVNRKGEPMEIQFLSRTDVVWAQRLFTPCWLCENQRSKSTDKSNCCCFSKTEGQLADMYCMWFNDGYRQDVIDTHPTRCPQSGIKGQRVPVGWLPQVQHSAYTLLTYQRKDHLCTFLDRKLTLW